MLACEVPLLSSDSVLLTLADPTSSATLFEMLRECDAFQHSPSFMQVDPSKQCGTAAHTGFTVYAILMLLPITFGVPLFYIELLRRHRHLIDPPAKDGPMKIRLRNADPKLAPLSFLFRDYRCDCWFAEPVECLRRMVMIGAIGFCGKGAMRSGTGTLVALVSVVAYREIQPFADELTNLLAYVAQWLVFFVFLSAFIIEARPFAYNDNALGGLLLGMVLVVFSFAGTCGLADDQRQREHVLRLREMEFREIEADMDIAELRADILQLREEYEPERLLSERHAQFVEDLGMEHRVEHQPSTRKQSFLLNTLAVTKKAIADIKFTSGVYPCYVVAIDQIRQMDRLMVHEDALATERLDVLTPSTVMPSSAFTYFIR